MRANGVPRQRLHILRAGSIVMACGAIERPLVFPGNDRPGVMLAGAVGAYVNRYGVLAGRRAVFATNNDAAYFDAVALARAGAQVTLADLRQQAQRATAGHGKNCRCRHRTGHRRDHAQGSHRVSSCTLAPYDIVQGRSPAPG
jgi:NADPH-dependent 2,4-dienoyl-CoA reductase/sulfur reductase-like enzyme